MVDRRGEAGIDAAFGVPEGRDGSLRPSRTVRTPRGDVGPSAIAETRRLGFDAPVPGAPVATGWLAQVKALEHPA
jgi:hypothetical protein